VTRITLTRTAVTGALTVTRLPLTAVELVTRRRGTAWLPATAFAMFEANVLRLAGAALRDEDLAAAGDRREDVAVRRTRAAKLEASASATEEKARQRREQREREAEQSTERARHRVEREREAIEAAAQERRSSVQRTAERRRDEAQQRAAAEQTRRAKRRRSDRLAVLEGQADAQDAATDAVETEKAALDTVDELDAVKERRRARA